MSAQDVATSDSKDAAFFVRFLEDEGAWLQSWRFQFEQLIINRGGEIAPCSAYSSRQRDIELYLQEMAEKITLRPLQPGQTPPARARNADDFDALDGDDLLALLDFPDEDDF